MEFYDSFSPWIITWECCVTVTVFEASARCTADTNQKARERHGIRMEKGTLCEMETKLCAQGCDMFGCNGAHVCSLFGSDFGVCWMHGVFFSPPLMGCYLCRNGDISFCKGGRM